MRTAAVQQKYHVHINNKHTYGYYARYCSTPTSIHHQHTIRTIKNSSISTSRWLSNWFFSAHSYKMEVRKIFKTNLSMCIFGFRAFLGICKQMVKTTHEFLIKSTKHLLHFSVPTQNTMNAKFTSNINLAKKLGSRQ